MTYVAKINRHFNAKHANEIEVIEAIANADKKKSNALFMKLRNIGNHKHNIDVLKAKTGTLEVMYRPKAGALLKPSQYIPCQFCFGYYCRAELWRHAAN